MVACRSDLSVAACVGGAGNRRAWRRRAGWRRSNPEVGRLGRQELTHDNGARRRSHDLAWILPHWETGSAHGRRRRSSHLRRRWRAIGHGLQFAWVGRRHKGLAADWLKNQTRGRNNAHDQSESDSDAHVSLDLIFVLVHYGAQQTAMSFQIRGIVQENSDIVKLFVDYCEEFMNSSQFTRALLALSWSAV
jgi:hypothetical protein